MASLSIGHRHSSLHSPIHHHTKRLGPTPPPPHAAAATVGHRASASTTSTSPSLSHHRGILPSLPHRSELLPPPAPRQGGWNPPRTHLTSQSKRRLEAVGGIASPLLVPPPSSLTRFPATPQEAAARVERGPLLTTNAVETGREGRFRRHHQRGRRRDGDQTSADAPLPAFAASTFAHRGDHLVGPINDSPRLPKRQCAHL